MPQIIEATGCGAFLTSWKPGSASDGLAVPIHHVEPDQHEPEDPLHGSTARALTAIAAHFHRYDEQQDVPLGAMRINETAAPGDQAFGTPDGRQNNQPDSLHPRQRQPPPAAEQLTIACVEVTDTLAEDVIHIATCLSINAIILLFHITHYQGTTEH